MTSLIRYFATILFVAVCCGRKSMGPEKVPFPVEKQLFGPKIGFFWLFEYLFSFQTFYQNLVRVRIENNQPLLFTGCVSYARYIADLDAGKTILRAIGTPFTCFHFRAQKSLYFQGPPLPMALKMDLLPSKRMLLLLGVLCL